MTAATAAQRQARRRERKRLRGLIRVECWIPDTEEAKAALAAFLAHLTA